jgi:NADPH-dependent 2,4-dienoyl-CoA reductase/sulfur reductase-like enzyme
MGRTLATDFAVAGIGVEPVVDFLAGSGVEVGNGVLVNQRFETSVPGIYAVGDVANFYDPLYSRRRRIEHWSNANYQGAEVGRILAGASGGYDTVSTFFSEIFDLTVKVFGDLSDHDELIVRGSIPERDLLGFYLQRGRLIATLVVGQDKETEEWLKRLIKDRGTVDPRLLGDESPDSGAIRSLARSK